MLSYIQAALVGSASADNTGFFENVRVLFDRIGSVLSSFGFWDFIDIVFVAFLLFEAIKLMRETRAFQFVKGLVIIAVIYFAVKLVSMQATSYLFGLVFSNFILIVFILFQKEFRHAIEQMGRSWSSASFSLFGFGRQQSEKEKSVREAISQISEACKKMSDDKVGSLIIIERKTLLGDIADTGTVIDAQVSSELIGNIFFPNSPLHDGAAIIRDGRIYCARCVLPLTGNNDLPGELGMRHRAALGVTEQSDCVAIVTSEETGNISICTKGVIERDFTEFTLKERLVETLISADESGVGTKTNMLTRIKEWMKR